MADVTEIATRFRRDLLSLNNEALKEVAAAFAAAHRRVQVEWERLGREIELAQARGEEIGPSWLFQYDRLGALKRRLELETRTLYDYLAGKVTSQQAAAVDLGVQYARESLRAQVEGLFTYPDPDALRAAVGFMRDGPVREVLERRAGALADELARTIQAGIILGRNPREIGREIRDVFGLRTAHAMTLARTEALRAYRDAAWQAMIANADVVRGWVWHAHPSKRTCAVCLARHGSFHRIAEPFNSHPNCRCSPVPVTHEWRELFPGSRAKETALKQVWDGNAFFMRLSAEEQIEKLGFRRFLLHRFQRLPLQGLVTSYRDPKWGIQYKLIPVAGMDPNFFQPFERLWARAAPVEKRMRAELERLAGQLVKIVERETGLKSRWASTVYVTDVLDFTIGVKRWDCGVEIGLGALRNKELAVKTLLHELIHSVSVGLNPDAYRTLTGYEEGPVEGLARVIYDETVRGELGLGPGDSTAYERYIQLLAAAAKTGKIDLRELYLKLLRTPLSDRPGLLRKILPDAEAKRIHQGLATGAGV